MKYTLGSAANGEYVLVNPLKPPFFWLLTHS